MVFLWMRKILFVIFCFVVVLLAWCDNSGITEINPDNWISDNWFSVSETFDQQIEEAQYIKDLTNFISYDLALLTGDIPFVSDFSFSAKFDENSSVQWWIDFSQKKVSKSRNLESSDIDFNIIAEKQEKDLTPFDLSWSVTFLYKDNEVYANLHNLWVFMGEGNMVAKMYTLLWDLLVDNRVNLEVHSWGIITIDENENIRLPYIVWTIKNVLKTEDIQESPDFLWSIVELIDIISSRIDLWISTNELTLKKQEISYFELSDKSIQKQFTWVFQWKESIFDLSFVASKKWFNLHLYNIREYDEEASNYKDIEQEFLITIMENKNSDYSVLVEFLKTQQKIFNLKWEIDYGNVVHFFADFVLEPLELVARQNISWKIDWNIVKGALEWDRAIPELTGNILLRNELISSL